MDFKKALAAAIAQDVDTALISAQETEHRWHIGASQIGRSCRRQVWYGWRWVYKEKFAARILRLFDRGHKEEARVIDWLTAAGITVQAFDANGSQIKIIDRHGHFGGSLDLVLSNLPGIASSVELLGEVKTHNDKSFAKLKAYGVAKAKPEHVAQMQTYMAGRKLPAAVYIAVNKNDDDLYIEVIEYDADMALHWQNVADDIREAEQPPQRLSETPTYYECRYCPVRQNCHGKATPLVNCRTCAHSSIGPDGTWLCEKNNYTFHKEAEYADRTAPDIFSVSDTPRMHDGCADHVFNPRLLNGVEYIGGNADENYAELKMPNGTIVRNGPLYTKSIDLVIV